MLKSELLPKKHVFIFIQTTFTSFKFRDYKAKSLEQKIVKNEALSRNPIEASTYKELGIKL